MGSKNLSPGFLVAVRVDSGDPMHQRLGGRERLAVFDQVEPVAAVVAFDEYLVAVAELVVFGGDRLQAGDPVLLVVHVVFVVRTATEPSRSHKPLSVSTPGFQIVRIHSVNIG